VLCVLKEKYCVGKKTTSRVNPCMLNSLHFQHCILVSIKGLRLKSKTFSNLLHKRHSHKTWSYLLSLILMPLLEYNGCYISCYIGNHNTQFFLRYFKDPQLKIPLIYGATFKANIFNVSLLHIAIFQIIIKEMFKK
jgi:hypothetical protein